MTNQQLRALVASEVRIICDYVNDRIKIQGQGTLVTQSKYVKISCLMLPFSVFSLSAFL